MDKITLIPISKIRAGSNDRTVFDQNELQSLAASIKKHGKGKEGKGLLQPITVRKVGSHFEIIAGERRFRACQILKWNIIPGFIVKVTDEEAAALMLVENTSRKDLDPIDEARAYQIRIEKFGWSEEECALNAGTSTTRVKFRLKLLSLRDDIQSLIRTGNLQIGYAQILSDADLDTNRQLLAIKALRENPRPTPAWFRSIVNDYREQQLQAGLFDVSNFLVCQEIPVKIEEIDPPLPSTTTPPAQGKSLEEIIHNHIEFWIQAADAWDTLGRNFKKNECLAAAQALRCLTV